jgi:hypothetical protein
MSAQKETEYSHLEVEKLLQELKEMELEQSRFVEH